MNAKELNRTLALHKQRQADNARIIDLVAHQSSATVCDVAAMLRVEPIEAYALAGALALEGKLIELDGSYTLP